MRDRKANRFKTHDYSRAGGYFVTICARDRVHYFGEVESGAMTANAAGKMVERTWSELPECYEGVEIDQFQLMPDHVHGIIVIVETAGAGPRACPPVNRREREGQPQGVVSAMSLSDVIHRFKSLTTRRYVAGVKNSGWRPFDGKLWQRSFYDRVIRDDDDMNRIREYARNNPLRWALDEERPRDRKEERDARRGGRRDAPRDRP